MLTRLLVEIIVDHLSYTMFILPPRAQCIFAIDKSFAFRMPDLEFGAIMLRIFIV